MKKQKPIGRSKVLIFLIGFGFLALLAMAVVWSTRLMNPVQPTIHTPQTTYIKIKPAPTADKTKIPSPPRLSPPNMPKDNGGIQPAAPNPSVAAAPQEAAPQATMAKPMAGLQPETVQKPSSMQQHAVDEKTDLPAEVAKPEKDEINPEPQKSPPVAAAGKEEAQPQVVTTAALPKEEVTADAPAQESAPAKEISQQSQAVAQQTANTSPVKPAPAPTQSPSETAASDAPTARFNLQVGAYRVESYAMEAVARLAKKGYDPFIAKISDSRQRIWYTVRMGRFDSREKAAAYLEQVKQKEEISAVIARAGKL